MNRWLYVHLGLASATGAWCLLWSGIAGDFGLFFSGCGWAVHGIVTYRHADCHQHGCPWIGRYPVAGGPYKACRRHHPDPVVRGGIRQHHLRAAHERYQERTMNQ
jgi:hypothetical protein